MGSNRGAGTRWAMPSTWALLALLLVGLLAGCSSSAKGAGTSGSGSTPTATASPKANETPTATASTSWATYTNTKYGYTIEYPTEWFPLDTSPTAGDFIVFNYDTSKVEVPPFPPAGQRSRSARRRIPITSHRLTCSSRA
jgi:hypothetical protein